MNKEAWMDVSNVMLVHEGKATESASKMEGDKKVRFAKSYRKSNRLMKRRPFKVSRLKEVYKK